MKTNRIITATLAVLITFIRFANPVTATASESDAMPAQKSSLRPMGNFWNQNPDPSGWYKPKGEYRDLAGYWFGPEGLAKVRILFFQFPATWYRQGNAIFVKFINPDGDEKVSRFLIQSDGTLMDVDDETTYTTAGN